VPHILVYRKSGAEFDVPNYNLPPAQAAAEHWQRHRAVFPPELLPYKHMIWLETINEKWTRTAPSGSLSSSGKQRFGP
jgi:hypothetical protein